MIKNGYGKYVLREAISGIVNEKVRLDRRKKGFNASVNSIVNLRDPDTLDYLFNDNSIVEEFINVSKLRKLLAEEFIPNHFSKFIFNFINFKLFIKAYG